MNRLKDLYIHLKGAEPASIEKLPGAGSNREYYRMTDGDGHSVIGVIGTSQEENHAFVYLAQHFRKQQLPVPELYAVSDDEMCYLQEDLGRVSLFDAISNGRKSGGHYNEQEKVLLVKTIRELPRMQVIGAQGLEFENCYPQPSFDREGVFFDLNYFKYCFLKATDIEFNEVKLEESFRVLADDLTAESGEYFLYRDFQARNVMLDAEGNPRFIDFQGGRRGPFYYDVASFLWQASARYSAELREQLIGEYYRSLAQYTDVPCEEHFRGRLQLFVLFRTLQVLGAYGFRGYFERKKHFIDSIPPAIANLRELIDNGVADEYPYLKDVCQRMIEAQPKPFRHDGLVVRVFSFSYKKGIPEDISGNGGGYVFDCRSTNNPGRYKEYKHVTGRDASVIEFLEKDGEILQFLGNIYPLVDFHVQRWLDRGFNDLQISFGCTGGQHRSVYSAEHVAHHIHDKFGVKVILEHREQKIKEILPAVGGSAMIFAAGLGTRLKPLTDTMPKALVPVAGKPLLQHVLDKLHQNGFDNIVVNVHHFAQQVVDYLSETDVKISDETTELLETGGGLKKALPLFGNEDPVLIHNVDILSNVDLKAFYDEARGNDATLLVSWRKTQRYLIFDNDMRLVGWTNLATGEVKSPYPEIKALESEIKKMDGKLAIHSSHLMGDGLGVRLFAFSGIHCVSPSLSKMMQTWPDRFPIMDFYIQSCKDLNIKGIVKEDLRLMDVGKLDTINEAEAFIKTI